MSYTHTCACGTKYASEDADPYLCEKCIEKRRIIAAEVDARLAARPKKPRISELQAFESLPKVRGFVSAKDLGL